MSPWNEVEMTAGRSVMDDMTLLDMGELKLGGGRAGGGGRVGKAGNVPRAF